MILRQASAGVKLLSESSFRYRDSSQQKIIVNIYKYLIMHYIMELHNNSYKIY